MAAILVIDDDEQIRRMIKWVLQKEGHQVLEARDGSEGIALCRHLPVDLIITDILMPDKDGLDVLVEIRAECPDANIVAMSGGGTVMSSAGCLHLAADLGAREVLTKPIAKKRLLEVVNKLLSKDD
jgi:CheY-like chemotaxis protein